MSEKISAASVKWPESGLIPAIVQDYYTGRVLMLAYVNEKSLNFMLEKGETCFWSRSRNELWHKGATSGDVQKIKHMALDCDNDTLLILAEQMGKGACHTGAYTCFGNDDGANENAGIFDILQRGFKTVQNRAASPVKDSYTNYLLTQGTDKICKKIGEEAAEVIIAAKNAKNGDPEELTAEIADLYYHLLVLMQDCGISPNDVNQELSRRAGKKI